MNKIELLAPAGDLQKAKIAFIYGADAVFIGGEQFSLRAQAGHFSLKDIAELVVFAHQKKKKVYVTMNAIFQDEDFAKADEVLLQYATIGIDAVIVSSIAFIRRIRALNLKIDVHVSTQASIMNESAIRFYQSLGVYRVVLARECSVNEIQALVQNTTMELEIFIHGGLCAGVSGRCSLSNVMSHRDANRGGCAHSCRWNYTVKREQEIPFHFGSRDLCTLQEIAEGKFDGVASLKIEGRMKSAHYIATVVSAYRRILDADTSRQKMMALQDAEHQMRYIDNRHHTTAFLKGSICLEDQLSEAENRTPHQSFVGFIDEQGWIEVKALISVGETLQVFTPNGEMVIEVLGIIDEMEKEVSDTRKAKKIKIKTQASLLPYSILRK